MLVKKTNNLRMPYVIRCENWGDRVSFEKEKVGWAIYVHQDRLCLKLENGPRRYHRWETHYESLKNTSVEERFFRAVKLAAALERKEKRLGY